MELRQLFLRVYIRIDSGYDVATAALKSLNLLDLLKEVAKANPNGDTAPLYDVTNGKFYEKRTKRFVVRKVNKFIAGIPDAPSENENMADFASLNQLNNLIRAFNEDKKRISCFGLVYVYVMYSLMEGQSPAADCANYVVALHNLVAGYHEDHPEDEVVAFFIGCFGPIIRAIQARNADLTGVHLPGRPCQHPKEI